VRNPQSSLFLGSISLPGGEDGKGESLKKKKDEVDYPTQTRARQAT